MHTPQRKPPAQIHSHAANNQQAAACTILFVRRGGFLLKGCAADKTPDSTSSGRTLECAPVLDPEQVSIPDVGGETAAVAGVYRGSVRKTRPRSQLRIQNIDAGGGLNYAGRAGLQACKNMPAYKFKNWGQAITVSLDEVITRANAVHGDIGGKIPRRRRRRCVVNGAPNGVRISRLALDCRPRGEPLKKQNLRFNGVVICAEAFTPVPTGEIGTELKGQAAGRGCDGREFETRLHIADAASPGERGCTGIGNKEGLNPAERHLHERRKATQRRVFAIEI
jgi:hypothetical protein